MQSNVHPGHLLKIARDTQGEDGTLRVSPYWDGNYLGGPYLTICFILLFPFRRSCIANSGKLVLYIGLTGLLYLWADFCEGDLTRPQVCLFEIQLLASSVAFYKA